MGDVSQFLTKQNREAITEIFRAFSGSLLYFTAA
jgi:hypothetical protein